MESNAIMLDSSTTVDFPALAKAQPDITELQTMQTDNNSLGFTKVAMPTCSNQHLCDMSTCKPYPYVPETFRQTVFNSLQTISHPGVRASRQLITSHFFCPKINADISKWAHSCLQCQPVEVN